MSSGRWKRHEREWGAWAGAHRIPSQGVEKEDLMADDGTWVAEHKTTKVLPVWLAKAIEQRRENERRTGLESYILITLAPGQGRKTSRFIIAEVDFDTDRFDDEREKLKVIAWELMELQSKEK